MSGYNNYIATKDFMNEENFESDEHKNIGMAQTICLFKKYLHTRNHQHGFGKTNMEESEAIRKRTPPPRPMIPPNFDFNLTRPASFLEQELLPGIEYVIFFFFSFFQNQLATLIYGLTLFSSFY